MEKNSNNVHPDDEHSIIHDQAPHDALTLRDVLNQPVELEQYPWEVNPFSPTPLDWQNIAGKEYFFRSLHYMMQRINNNIPEGQKFSQLRRAALEECHHAHSQACRYSEVAIANLRRSPAMDSELDNSSIDLLNVARSAMSKPSDAGLIMMSYPVDSMEAAKYTAGCDPEGFDPYYAFIYDDLDKLKANLDTSDVDVELEIYSMDGRERQPKSHANSIVSEYVAKHPLIDLDKIVIARMSGVLSPEIGFKEIELIAKESRVAREYDYLVKPPMSADVTGTAYWRNVDSKKK